MDWINLADDGEKVAGCFELGNDSVVSIKCGEFID